MTARFVRERRCRICEHRVHPVADRRPPRLWDAQCDEGCTCTTARCIPYRIYTDGTTDRPELGQVAPPASPGHASRPVIHNSSTGTQESSMTNTQQYSADDFLMGGGVASAKFPAFGSSASGRITEKPTVSQQTDFTTGEPKVWADGSPQLQLVVTLATDQHDPEIQDDDGTRRIYVKGQMKKAVQDAVRKAGAKGLEVGGVLTVTYVADGQKTNPKFAAPKQYSATYVPAATAELNRPDPVAAPVAAPSAVPGLTAEQLAQAQANPATAALLAQLLPQNAPAPVPAGDAPAF